MKPSIEAALYKACKPAARQALAEHIEGHRTWVAHVQRAGRAGDYATSLANLGGVLGAQVTLGAR
jgi:hypothetical protein